MLFSRSTKRAEPRKFAFTPFYYKEEQEEAQPGERRIRFKRIRRRQVTSKKTVRLTIAFAILVLIFLLMFWDLVRLGVQSFKLEDIKIEEAPSLP